MNHGKCNNCEHEDIMQKNRKRQIETDRMTHSSRSHVEVDDYCVVNWTRQFNSNTNKKKLRRFDFIGNPGIKIPVSEDTPFNNFRLFLTDIIIDKIIVETNIFSEQMLSKNIKISSDCRH
jgi:hypothetical protein